jgi:putative SOS response-associated peptidase YedK
MCGRFTLHDTPTKIIDSLDALDVADWSVVAAFQPSYNVAPTISTPTISGGERPDAQLRRWGLVPHWAKELAIGNRMINARAETLAEKPAFRSLIAKKRCVVPINGYYEWKKTGDGKTPYYIHSVDSAIMLAAGLHSSWLSPDEERFDTYTIITCEPSADVAQVHDRMPVILDCDGIEKWLYTERYDQHEALQVLQPYSGALAAYAVSRLVNSPRHNSPLCLDPEPDERDDRMLPGLE